MISSVLPVLGCTAKDASEEVSLGRVYSAYHVAIERLGHQVQWPDVIAARNALATEWMRKTISSAHDAPLEGVLKLD